MFKTIRLWWRVLRLTRLMLKSVHWHLKAVEDPEWLARFDRGELPFKPGDLLLDLTVTRDALELTLSVCEGLDAKTEARMESAKSHINEAIAALAEIYDDVYLREAVPRTRGRGAGRARPIS